MNKKKIFERRKKRNQSKHIGPFSLSKTFQKKISKQTCLDLTYYLGSSKKVNYKFWTLFTKATLKIPKNHLISVSLAFVQIVFKYLSKFQDKPMDVFYLKLGRSPSNFRMLWNVQVTKIIKWSIYLICHCSIIGNILPLLKMQIQSLQNSYQTVWLASKFDKLYNDTNFIKFWNV